MALLDTIAHLQQHGMDLLQEVHGLSKYDLMRRGVPRSVASSWMSAANLWFGRTRAKRKQTEAQRCARENRHSLDTLRMIDRHARALHDPSRAWALRLELTRISGSYEDVDKVGRARVEELNAKEEAPKPKPTVSFSNHPSEMTSTLHYTDAEHVIAGIKAQLKDTEDPAQAFHDMLHDGGATAPQQTTTAIVSLEDLAQILRRNDGSGDTIIARTDGSRITGRDFVQQQFTDHGFAVLVHPLHGPVDAYRIERFANEKQRIMAEAENPVCPWDDCGQPADHAQIHHLDSWEHGGETNSERLCVACKYHNGVNDDDPNAPPRRGRLIRKDGQVHYQPPGGGPPRLNQHPTARLGAMRII